MQISQLEKIVNDGLSKLKAFKEAETALDELKALAQAETDLSLKVAALKKESAAIAAENTLAADKLKAAKEHAAKLLEDASKKASEAVEIANQKAVDILDKAQGKANTLEANLSDKKATLLLLEDEVSKAKTELDKIKAILKSSKDELRKIVGE